MKKLTMLDHWNETLAEYGFVIDTYSPGDGATRYRFFSNAGDRPDYFSGHGIYTALGWKEAEAFARGLLAGADQVKQAPMFEAVGLIRDAATIAEDEGIEAARSESYDDEDGDDNGMELGSVEFLTGEDAQWDKTNEQLERES